MSSFEDHKTCLLKILLVGCTSAVLVSCANSRYELAEPPNYDYLVGKSFSEAIFKGRQIYKPIRETETLEELESRRADGCILVFGVRKRDDIIEYWRVDSGYGSCFNRKEALSR